MNFIKYSNSITDLFKNYFKKLMISMFLKKCFTTKIQLTSRLPFETQLKMSDPVGSKTMTSFYYECTICNKKEDFVQTQRIFYQYKVTISK